MSNRYYKSKPYHRQTMDNINGVCFSIYAKKRNDNLKKKDRPTAEEQKNRDILINQGILFYEEGNRIEKLTEEEYNNLGYYFKQGYEIARRRAYAKTLTKK